MSVPFPPKVIAYNNHKNSFKNNMFLNISKKRFLILGMGLFPAQCRCFPIADTPDVPDQLIIMPVMR